MRILIVGAAGFIGGHIARALARDGHEIVCAGRDPTALERRFPGCEAVGCDLASDSQADWAARLTGVDAVVNAAGILRGDFEAVQTRGPIRLFEACAAANVARVVQISGLGAAPETPARFLATKAPADAHLRALGENRANIGWTVLRPGVVIGDGGQATRMFQAMAAFPWPIGIGDGRSRLSVVAVEDVAAAVSCLMRQVPHGVLACDLVAPCPLTTDELTLLLRDWLGLPPRPMLRLPYALLARLARWGAWLGFASATPETFAMMRAGLVGNPRPAEALLGRPVATLRQALAGRPATRDDLRAARRVWARPLLAAGVLSCAVGLCFLEARR